MFDSFKKKRKWTGRGLFFILLIGLCSSGVLLVKPSTVLASTDAASEVAADAAKSLCLTSGPTPSFCLPEGISAALKTTYNKIISPQVKMIAVKSTIDLLTFAANRVAYEAAMYISNGGAGEGSMFYEKSSKDAWYGLLRDGGGELFASLSDYTKATIGLDMCAPTNPLIRLNIQMSIKQRYTSAAKPRCDWDSIGKNWSTLYSDATTLFDNNPFERDQYLYRKLAEGLRPGTNELGASIGILNYQDQKVERDTKLNWSKQIYSATGIKDVQNYITGDIKTPSSIVADDFKDKLKAAKGDESKVSVSDVLSNGDVWWGLVKTMIGTFTNTAASQLSNRIYKGLFSPKPEAVNDPFNTELAGNVGKSASAKADFGSVFSATPLPDENFDILSEFTQCPPEGYANRGLNQCVLDVSFVTALSRGAITVKEAVDQKVLDGNWPLISSNNLAANNDRLCYTYGFCYGNLVKMRKARIIPIGWELAAEKQTVANPVSLKQVMDAFNDCNEDGQMDEEHKWCHLIDPSWVLKVPEMQCRASAMGEIRVSPQAAGRQSYCADAPTCIGEDNTGKCTQGFGYCVQEKNIWRIKGDECPAQYATCMTLKDVSSGKESSYLLNTVDNASCTKQNAGCAWYKTQKSADANGVYQWYNGASAYDVANNASSFRYQGGAVKSYSYEDRLYLTHAAKICSQDQAGCTELNVNDAGLTLNLVNNGSFEKDEDQNGVPDGWMNTNKAKAAFIIDGGAFDAQKSVQADGGYYYQSVKVNPDSFYTFSAYASSKDADQKISISLYPRTATGAKISIAGLTSSGDCVASADKTYFDITKTVTAANGWTKFVCTMTLPKTATQVEVDMYDLNAGAPKVQYDGIQLETGEFASSFKDGYSTTSPTKNYLKVAPAYLGCKGAASDSKECASYAQVCSALDVGCNLYTPKERGPAVPAIASAVDQCPNTCVGYDSYRQEGTIYEPAKFPTYFIADKAASCPAQAVGCDGFTQLGSNGGESQEYYTQLRACMTPEMATGSGSTTSSTFFTWQGSDKTGYQLQTWQLLKSNLTPAPCVRPQVATESTVVCSEDAASTAAINADTSCDEHTDIFSNPDCREFFDAAGVIHYRLYSQTVSVDSACTPYRKDVSKETDCKVSGGFWSTQGFCRYFGLKKESNACTAAQNGCRKYTGGAGRNSTTILNETFENGTYAAFTPTTTNTPKLSNDSVANGGHSISVIASEKDKGIQTAPATLSSNLVKGKVYSLQFWAKGTEKITAGFQDAGNGTKHYFVEGMDLTNNWSSYQVGPLDTNDFAAFDKTAVLFFTTEKGEEFFLDNIELIQGEGDITRIKDSWVTPAVCDQTPDGIESPQYYLGCKAYTDRKGVEGSYYQFSHMCSESAIGCSAYFNTYNSDSAYEQVNNARCVKGALPNGDVVTTPTSCVVNGATYCTIPIGQSYCVFSVKQAFQDPLPKDTATDFSVVYGPETVVTPQDQSLYLVDNGQAQCSQAFKGCTEVGAPDFAQDQKTVAKFESKYVISDPGNYGNILCENRALRCEEYTSAKDGNFYFKDPLKKTCEYKTSVTVAGKTLSGWFRSGTSEPCYPKYLVAGDQAQIWRNGDTAYEGWVGACEPSANRCTELNDATDTSPENHGKGKSYYVINNDKLTGAAVASSEKCDGRVGQKAGCALFNNTTVSQLNYSSSASYVLSLHADLLLGKEQNILVDPISCLQNGGVFPITAETSKKLADEDTAGVISKVPHKASKLSVDLCERRCVYTLPAPDSLLTPSATNESSGYWNERSCLFNSDCPELTSKNGKALKGECRDNGYRVRDDANTILKVNRDRTCAAWLACDSGRTAWDNNANKYIEICDSVNLCTQTGKQGDQAQCQNWNPRAPVVMTDKLYASRDVSWAGTDYSGYEIPHQLPVERYSQFNLNPKKWCEKDNKKSCETASDCVSFGGGACKDAPSDFRLVYNAGACDSSTGVAGKACQIGVCKGNGVFCAADTECTGSGGGLCVTGYCKKMTATACESDADCTTGEKKCDLTEKLCIDSLTSASGTSSTNACADGTKFVTAATTIMGACYQDRCLTGIKDGDNDGFTDPLSPDSDNVQSCRGYPELDSPFPQKVVKEWKRFLNSKKEGADQKAWIKELVKSDSFLVNPLQDGKYILELGTDRAEPANFVSGYEGSKVCSPVLVDGVYKANDDCLCSYTKATYAKGTETRYFPTKESISNVPTGICTGGLLAGKTDCVSDADCTVKTGEKDANTNVEKEVIGTCQLLTSANSMFGWEGYCLEKDSSIQLNGSTESKDQACLTWLPVDQLSGATDLYGKDMSAGYQVASDTYYCAEPTVAWNLPVTSVACAAYEGAGCTDSWNAKPDEIEEDTKNDKPWNSVYCPKNHYAIMAPCGTNFQGKKADDGANDYQCYDDDTDFSDDSYPYFCVPKNSFNVGSEKINTGKPGGTNLAQNAQCLSPYDYTVDDILARFTTNGSPSYVAGNSSQEGVYIVRSETFTLLRKIYADCLEKGVLGATLDAYFGKDVRPDMIPSNFVYDKGFIYDGFEYNNFKSNAYSYPACKSLIQTGKSGPSGELNAAWTDRVWQGSKEPYVLKEPNGSVSESYGYKANTENSVFGRAIELSMKNGMKPDPEPMHVLACGIEKNIFVLPKVSDGKCLKAGKLVDPTDYKTNDARVYAELSYGQAAYTITSQTAYCVNNDCSCNDAKVEGQKASAQLDCNTKNDKTTPVCEGIKMTCTGGKENGKSCLGSVLSDKCTEGGGKCDQIIKGTCKNYADGSACESNEQCQPNVCINGLFNIDGAIVEGSNCVSKPAYPKASSGAGFKATDAIARLKQIFAKSFHEDLMEFTDDENPQGSYETSKDAVAKTTWKWDERATANGTSPKPPIVTSVGKCVGASCLEGKNGKFSVNNQDSGTILGLGAKHTSVTFFVQADKNQMPLRNIVIDWGDDKQGVTKVGTGISWPKGKISGSITLDNFYKNYRGLNPKSPTKSLCDSDILGFGGSSEACYSGYKLFGPHDYTCTNSDILALQQAGRICQTSPDSKTGSIVTSPCVEKVGEDNVCVFQPRVHAADNWGWCTGYCDANKEGENTTACFSQECDISKYPSDGSDKFLDSKDGGKIVNPWVYYEGTIKIKPIQ
jgi:hypothetical protein